MRGSILTSGVLRDRLADSWRMGCPVELADLCLLEVPHVVMTGGSSVGEMVVNGAVADALLDVFAELYAMGFPIERMDLIDAYGGDDNASMAANNTSAFNCRIIPGTSQLSQHAYGLAVDLNPALNPYMFNAESVLPPGSEKYLDRSLDVPGMIGGRVVEAFAAIGWSWGGAWDGLKDYHHFSASGG